MAVAVPVGPEAILVAPVGERGQPRARRRAGAKVPAGETEVMPAVEVAREDTAPAAVVLLVLVLVAMAAPVGLVLVAVAAVPVIVAQVVVVLSAAPATVAAAAVPAWVARFSSVQVRST